jgi:hypothetical protein
MFAGGPYWGDATASYPADWSFTDHRMLVGIETQGPHFRHAVTILCVAADGDLFVMARHAPTKRWVQNVGRSPNVRLGIGGDVYEARLVRVEDAATLDLVSRAFLRKYVGIEVDEAHSVPPPAPSPAAGEQEDYANVWTWRVEPRGAS